MEQFLEQFDAPRLRTLRQSLLRWYDRQARPLPWRQTRDPYRIWISEIMLQQTTVKAVIPYYERFLSRFPTVADLATADETEVLQFWEGLGYYSRGRNLRLAARHICAEWNGQFPSDLATLRKLPGIGRYTAGAIRSFAFNLPAPIVEANTLRLYCRLLGYDGDPRSQSAQNLLWAFAERLQPPRIAGHLNQALMELGATVCTPASPHCSVCPLARHCRAFQSARQAEIPAKVIRPVVTQTVEAALALRRGDQFLIRQRTTQERWAGLWDFIRFPVTSLAFDDKLTKRRQSQLFAEVAQHVTTLTGLECIPSDVITELRHSVTRYRIRLICLVACHGSARGEKVSDAPLKWVTLDELADLPMPVTGRKFARLLAADH